MIKLIDLLKEVKINEPRLVGNSFLNWVIKNKQVIANINPNYTDVIMESGEDLLDESYWTEETFNNTYPNYTYSDFINDWKKYKGSIVVLGEELSSVFVTAINLPTQFINIATGNDVTFFGTKARENNASKKYNIKGVTLYIVFGIPDPGS